LKKKYPKTKTELLKILGELKELHGSKYRKFCNTLNQQDGTRMLQLPMCVKELHLFFQRVPRDYDNPEGIQRALVQSKITGIENCALNRSRYTSPNAIVANILSKENNRVVSINEDSRINGLIWLEIDLDIFSKRLTDAETNENDYILDEEAVMLGFLIDGHHRSEGFYRAGKMDLELSLTLYVNLPIQEMPEVFVNINEHQTVPSKIHTLAMKAMSKSLDSQEEEANQIVNILNESEWSILFQRIKSFDGPVPKERLKPYVNANTFHTLSLKHVFNGLASNLNTITKADILNNYFSAWKNVFPDAWKDQKTHVLVKSLGFQIMIRLFGRIHLLAKSIYCVEIPEKNHYEELLRGSFGNQQQINIDGENSIPIDWSSKSYGMYSNGKGINFLTNLLKVQLTNSQSDFFNNVS
jgi:DGQHR domain-containing protein